MTYFNQNAIRTTIGRWACLLALLLPASAFADDCSAVSGLYARLACFEDAGHKVETQTGRRDACLSVAADADRLLCFELASRGLEPLQPQQQSMPSGPQPEGDDGTVRNHGEAVARAEPPVEHSDDHTNGQTATRLGVAGGYSVGDHSGAFSIWNGTLDLHSLTGGSGSVLAANAWWDGALSPDLSLGLEYLHIRNQGKGTLTLPHGVSVLTDPTEGHIKLAASADLAFFDVVYRPVLRKEIAPFLGGGIGVGYGSARADLGIDNPFIGGVGSRSSTGSAIGATQGLMGIDYYLSDKLYLSLLPRVIFLSGHPVGLSHRYVDTMITGGLGLSFY